MKIAISNIAWTLSDETIIPLMQKYNINGIEIAPTRVWKNPITVRSEEAKAYKKYWNNKNIFLIAMQSLLYGRPELTIFENKEKRANTIAYLSKIMRLAFFLNIKTLVFGSPFNRNTFGITGKRMGELASEFFDTIGAIAKRYEIFFCIEPNPRAYGTDFLNGTMDVFHFVRELHNANIKVHLDTGAMRINDENYAEVIKNAAPFFHFHISEPFLKPVPGMVDHKKVSKALQTIDYDKWISIEMKAVEETHQLKTIDQTLSFVHSCYF